MKKSKLLFYDGLLALVIIFGISACEQQFNAKKSVANVGGAISILGSIANN